MTAFLIYAATWATVSGGVWLLFAALEEASSKSTKKAISGWLRNLEPSKGLQIWGLAVKSAFDKIFYYKHLSIKCLVRSTIASFAVVLIVCMIIISNHLDFVNILLRQYGALKMVRYLLAMLLVTVVPDYVSLLETRYAIGLMSRFRNKYAVSVLLIVDLIITYLMSCISLNTALMINMITSGLLFDYSLVDSTIMTLKNFQAALVMPGNLVLSDPMVYASESGGILYRFPEAPWIYATFATSIWLWLFGISTLVLRFGRGIDLFYRWILSRVSIVKTPFKSIGAVALLIVSLCFIIGLPFAL